MLQHTNLASSCSLERLHFLNAKKPWKVGVYLISNNAYNDSYNGTYCDYCDLNMKVRKKRSEKLKCDNQRNNLYNTFIYN